MPCPLFSPEENDCRLPRVVVEEDEQGTGAPIDDPVDLAYCLAEDARYQQCPAYRKQVAELLP